MQDEQRAAWLAATLDGDEPPETIDDQELLVLAALGAELRRAGPDVAGISRAEAAFSPTFASALRDQLRAAHPATTAPDQRPAPRPFWRRGSRMLRSLVALAVLALAVTALLVASLVQGLEPSARTGSAAVPTAPRATRQAPRHTFQALIGHPPVQPRAQQAAGTPSTPARSTPAPSTAPGTAASPPPSPRTASGAAVQPSARANSGFAPMAPSVHAPSDGTLIYRFPASLPLVPAKLPIYAVRVAPLSAAGAARIGTRFPGLRAVAALSGVRVFSGRGGHLEITLAIGTVRYSAPTSVAGTASVRALPADAAIAAARAWLRSHGLYANGMDGAATTVTTAGALTRVSFAPPTRLPLTDGAGILWVRVDLTSGGRVVAARWQWPTLVVERSTGVLSPARAVAQQRTRQASATDRAAPRGAATPVPVFRVEQVMLAYQPSADGARLVPVYVLIGVVTTSDGAVTPTTQMLPAMNR